MESLAYLGFTKLQKLASDWWNLSPFKLEHVAVVKTKPSLYNFHN